jgi:uncharacterized membrane protein YgaE (UPF0421/DUF939 family)
MAAIFGMVDDAYDRSPQAVTLVASCLIVCATAIVIALIFAHHPAR